MKRTALCNIYFFLQYIFLFAIYIYSAIYIYFKAQFIFFWYRDRCVNCKAQSVQPKIEEKNLLLSSNSRRHIVNLGLDQSWDRTRCLIPGIIPISIKDFQPISWKHNYCPQNGSPLQLLLLQVSIPSEPASPAREGPTEKVHFMWINCIKRTTRLERKILTLF